jgi:hypothetical protein
LKLDFIGDFEIDLLYLLGLDPGLFVKLGTIVDVAAFDLNKV